MDSKFGTCTVTLVPIRLEAADSSEMISQLLFGECFRILEEKETWTKIKGSHDDYEGWIDRKQWAEVSENVVQEQLSCKDFCSEVFQEIQHKDDLHFITFGTPLVNLQGNSFWQNGKQWTIKGRQPEKPSNLEELVNLGERLVNVPYLWGGRSSAGIDCSGLMQVLFRMADINLPRDAWQQAEVGQLVDFNDRQVGDVAYFNNKGGRIIHVGVLTSQLTILHASGQVRIDDLNTKGILNNATQKYSHQFSHIRRLV